jgi:uncharacterized phiE125 gp8 family phage protein
MSSILLTPPAAEPLLLADAKGFLRVETDEDDALIAALVSAARLHVEAQTGLALLAQSWRMVLDRWPECGRIPVRPAPLRSVTAARVFDREGHAHAVDTQAFVPDMAAMTLAFVPWAMPLPTRIAAGIEVDIAVGFGDAPADVPEPLRHAIRLLAAHWYENRGVVAADARATVPSTVGALLVPYRRLSL